MVASISARGGAKAALSYYTRLPNDDYYTGEKEPPGRWAGDGAERLSLEGPVTRAEFEAALKGHDPKTGEKLVREGGHVPKHTAGWDMTFSAPKSVSVLWALSDEPERQRIEQSHRLAVLTATRHLERTTAWARRGAGSRIREHTAGLLMANFDHHSSRESDPHLHTHSFVFNLAPRRDGTWGAIVSRELYKAQMTVGAIYGRELADGLERLGHRIDREGEAFRVAAIPREIEHAFSKRQQAIVEAVRAFGYRTPKVMEFAKQRTRRACHDVNIDDLLKSWRVEAKALGFELDRGQQRISERPPPNSERSLPGSTLGRIKMPIPGGPKPESVNVTALQQNVTQIGQALGQILRLAVQPSGMSGLRPKLHTLENDRE